MIKTIPAGEARNDFSRLLDRAEEGEGTVILRNSRPAAAILPPEFATLAPIVYAVMKEFGLSLELSQDDEILEAFARAQEELSREEIVWYEV